MKYKSINKKILKIIKRNNIFSDLTNNDMYDNMFYKILDVNIEKYPHSTFGKILCDNFCDDYINNKENELENIIINRLYENINNWVDENPIKTLKRLEDKFGKTL